MESQSLDIGPGVATPIRPSETAHKGIAAAGGVIGAILASSCCIAPLVLLSLGVGGAWMSNLTALAPYQWIFVTIAAGFVGAGFWKVYRKPKIACEEGSYCASPQSDRVVKIALWGATVLILVALAFPYVAVSIFDL